MIICDGDTEKIQVVLAAAVTTNQLQCTSSWALLNETAFEQYDGLGVNTNSTTDVDVLVGVAGKQVALLSLTVFNADTVEAVVIIKKDVSGTEYILGKYTLAPNQSLAYSKDAGFQTAQFYSPPLTIVTKGALFAMTNATQAERWAGNTSGGNIMADLAGFTQVRMKVGLQTGSASANTPKYRCKYYTEWNTTVGNFLTLGASEVEVSVTTAGFLDTGWINLVAGAKANGICLGFTEVGGDGAADPAVAFVSLSFR